MNGRLQRLGLVVLAGVVLHASPSAAIIGGDVAKDPDGVRRHTVRVEGGRTLCTGVVIATDLVLTAAHCINGAGLYRVVALDKAFKPHAIPVLAAAIHKSYVPRRTALNQPGIDLALLRLAVPVPGDMLPVPFGALEGFADLSAAGFGVSRERPGAGARVLRQAALRGTTFERPNGPHVLAIGQTRTGAKQGIGACQGDSGGPLFAGQNGSKRLIGIISFAGGLPGRNNSCGGITAAIPVARHVDWIRERTAQLRGLSAGTVSAPTVEEPRDLAGRGS